MADVITWKAVHIDDVSEEVFEVGRAMDIAVDTAVDIMSRGKGRIMVRWKEVYIEWLVEEVVEAGVWRVVHLMCVWLHVRTQHWPVGRLRLEIERQ